MAAAASHPLPSIDTIEDDLSFFDDWEERYRYLIDLGKSLSAMSDEDKPVIEARDDGPLIAKNLRSMKGADGAAMDVKPVMALCRCGQSANKPFCDGSHHGTKIKPIAFDMKKKRTVKLCNCKHTKASPFCDDTHLKL